MATTLGLLTWLACRHAQPTWHAPDRQATTITWPAENWWPEQREGEHPSHEDPSPMFRGLVSQTNTSGRVITVDSGASASGSNYVTYATWLPSGLNLFASSDDLGAEAFQSPTLPHATIHVVAPDSKKYLANPSTVLLRRSYDRRR